MLKRVTPLERFSPSRTNHTGLEISRPDDRPVTVSSISRLASKAFLNLFA